MNDDKIKRAKEKALQARDLYNIGQINLKEAEEMMQDYRHFFNERAAEMAKKYNQKPQKFSLKMFIKYGR